MPKGALLGYFSIKIQKWGNFIIHDMAYFKKGSHSWISFPCKKVEGESMAKYYPYNCFENKEMQDQFSKIVVEILEDYLIKIYSQKEEKQLDKESSV